MPPEAAAQDPTATRPSPSAAPGPGAPDAASAWPVATPRDPAAAEGSGRQEGFPRRSGPRLRETIAVVSATMLVGRLVELAVLPWVQPDAGRALWKMWFVEMFAGREAGIPFAIGHVNTLLVAQVSAMQDIAMAGVVYPGFLYLLARYRHRDNLVMRKLRRIEAQARSNRHFVDRWGPLGVFAFMMVPFLVNGPLLGAAMGRLSGIPTRFLILPVVLATVLCSVLWTYFYDFLFSLVDPRWGPLLTGAILGSLLAWGLTPEWRDRRREAQRAATPSA